MCLPKHHYHNKSVIPAKAGIHDLFSMKNYYVYLLANKKNGTLYVGVTSDLLKRVYEHKQNVIEGFTKKYGIHNLVYFEQTTDIEAAIAREKCIKKWRRDWKIELIEENNSMWRDLYEDLV